MLNRNMGRREFLSSSAKVGVSFAALGTFLPSCAVTGERKGAQGSSAISMAINESPWLRAFEEITRVYREETGNMVNLQVFTFEGLQSKELNAVDARTGEFDLFTMFEGWYGSFFDSEFLTPLRDIDSDFEWPQEVITFNNVGRWDQNERYFSEDGTPFALPINGNMQLLFYRQDLYDEMGLDPPTTWDEAITAASTVGDTHSDVYGYTLRGQGGGSAVTFDFLPLLRGFGGDFFANPPKDWSVTINNDAGQQAIELFMELLSYGPSEPENIGQAEVISLMQSGRALQAHLVSAAALQMDEEAESTVPFEINYTVVPRPADGVHAPTAGPALMGIPTHIDDAQKQVAYDFLTWFMQRDAQTQYTRAGGSPVNRNIYESDLAEGTEFRYMQAATESLPHLHLAVAYPFAPELLEVTEQRLNEIAAGLLEPKEGLDTIASEIATVVEEAGFSS